MPLLERAFRARCATSPFRSRPSWHLKETGIGQSVNFIAISEAYLTLFWKQSLRRRLICFAKNPPNGACGVYFSAWLIRLAAYRLP